MMLPAMWQYPSRLPTEERRRTRKKNTISFPSWNGAAARAESLQSLEKQVRNKKHNKPKAAPEPEVETVELPAGTIMINVPITVAGFAEQTKTSVQKFILTLRRWALWLM